MSAIYTGFEINETDDLETKQRKLYLGVISLGEVLYQKGAAVAEMNKDFMMIEKELAKMREELHRIRELINGKGKKVAA
jgi:hypothetical protein